MDTATTIPDADSDTGSIVIQGFNSIAAELAAVAIGGLYARDILVGKGWFGGDGDDNGFLRLILYSGAERILKHLGDDVL